MDTISLYPHHKTNIRELEIGDQDNYSHFIESGKLHFKGDARPIIVDCVTGSQLMASHQNPLRLTSLAASAGIATDGLTTAPDATRGIEVIGINGGIQTKGLLTDAYARHDTTEESTVVKIRLSTMYGTNTWSQASEWRLILDIASGDGITGKFTVIMPKFSLLHYSTLELYLTSDGATYYNQNQMGFDYSMSGTSVATEDFLNDEVAGSDVLIEVTSTSGFYEGNEVFVSDSENSEWCRIKTIVSNTSITVHELTNSYTTANGAKFDQIDYTRTAETVPVQRGLYKMKQFDTGINSGIEFQYAIPHDIDNDETLDIMIQYVGTDANAGADVSKWRAQWGIKKMFTPIDESIQYSNLVYTDVTPPSTTVNSVVYLAQIAAADHAGKHLFSAQLVRLGADAGDTYSGDIRVIGIAMAYTADRLGYEP